MRSIAKKSDDLDLFSSAKEVWPGKATNDRQKLGEWVKREAWG